MTAPEGRRPSLLVKWMQEGVFKCLHCGSARLDLSTQAVACSACGGTWPVRNQVPDFFNQYTHMGDLGDAEPGAQDGDKEMIDTLMRVLDLGDGEDVRARVGEIVHRSQVLSCDNLALDAEIRDLMDRFAPAAVAAPLPHPVPQSNQDAGIGYVRHYFGERYAAGRPFCANVRLRNEGGLPWSSRTDVPRTLLAEWRGQGHSVVPAGAFAFPVDIAPGGCITLPLRLMAPGRPGRWQLRVGLADGGQRVPGAACLDIPLEVEPWWRAAGRDWAGRLPWRARPCRPTVRPEGLDYGADHALGAQLISDWVRATGRSGLRMLEVGSGTHPQTAWQPDLEVLAVDISAPMLELGSLYFGQRFVERLGFVCADAFDPPFMPAQFDAVAIFSALHHFAEPDGLLSALARLLRPGGVIFVMCEPVGDSLEGPEAVRDLAKGINEQIFSLDAYGRLFARAGLKPQSLRVDGGSLKTVLQRA